MPQARGCGVLFYRIQDGKRQILLFRRDNKPSIPFPGMLDILGGSVEPDECPEEALEREMSEELTDRRTGRPFLLEDPQLFKRYTDDWKVEQSIFSAPADFEITDLDLLEGEELVWVDEDHREIISMAFAFGHVVAEFFRSDWRM